MRKNRKNCIQIEPHKESCVNIPESTIDYKSFYTDGPSVGDIWNVFVTKPDITKYFYVQNSIQTQFIQEMCSTSCITDENDLNYFNNTVHVGTLIAAPYVNNVWYRAKVIKKNKMGLFVCFIDFDDIEVFVTDYRILPKELVDIKPLAYKCYIKHLSKEVKQIFLNHDFNKIFIGFMSNNEMTIEFLNDEKPYLVTLSYNGKNFLNIILEIYWEGIFPGVLDDTLNQKNLNLLNKIYLCDPVEIFNIEPIISTEHFFIELKLKDELSKNIKANLENEKNWIPVINPKGGQLVIARKKKDSKLYRARIILKCATGEEYKCFLIDCGLYENCSEFFEPNLFLKTVRPVKIHCSLNLSAKYDNNLLESINLGFIDEITNFNNFEKKLKLIKVGNPCIVNIIIKDLEVSEIIKPYNVTISQTNNVIDLNYFKTRMVSSGVKQIKNILKNINNFCKETEPQPFEIYVAKYNNLFKRVKLLAFRNSHYHVKLVDESDIRVNVDELYKLPKSIQNIKILDMYCSLGVDSKKYSNDKLLELSKKGNPFSMVVIKHKADGHLVKLFLNSKDVLSMIKI